MNPSDEPISRLDQVTSHRLSRLASFPVETARLDAMIESQIQRAPTGVMARIFRLRSVRAVAASIALLALVGVVVFSLSGGAVLASPDVVAQFHEELVSGKVNAIRVSSIAEANQALAAPRSGVEIPQMPADHAMVCCMNSIQDKRVACVLLKGPDGGDAEITLAVAKAMDMQIPKSTTRQVVNGVEYHLQSSSKGLNMVMTERNGRWICLIGQIPEDRLIRIATEISF